MNSGIDPDIFGKNTDLSRLSADFCSDLSIYTDFLSGSFLMASPSCSHLFSIEIRILKYCPGSKNQYFTFNYRKNAAIACNHKVFKSREYTQIYDILRKFSAIQRQF
jgi:hypothetical protein